MNPACRDSFLIVTHWREDARRNCWESFPIRRGRHPGSWGVRTAETPHNDRKQKGEQLKSINTNI